MIGTIIGAGVFGVPLIFQRTGVVVGSVIFWAVALLVWATHLLYIELISREPGKLRLAGYLKCALGSKAEKIGYLTHSLQIMGANFAYLILGGEFLSQIAAQSSIQPSLLTWQIIFGISGMVTVYAGLRSLARLESEMTWALMAVMTAIIIFAIPQARSGLAAQPAFKDFSMALGVFLFSLSGLTVIPEIHDISGSLRKTRLAVSFGSLVAATLIWIFGLSVYAAADGVALTSPSAISSVLPPGVWWLLPVFGFFAVATSFVTSAFDLRSMYMFDLKLSRTLSIFLTFCVPLLLLFVTSRNFLKTIDTVGSVFAAANGLLVAIAAYVVMNRSRGKPPWWWRSAVPSVASLVFLFLFMQKILALNF